MRLFADTAESISKTSSRLKKVRILAEFLQNLSDEDLRAAAVYFTGRPFPLADARTLNVGGAALARTVMDVTGASEEDLGRAYLEHGDLGEAARRLFPPTDQSALTPSQLLKVFALLSEASGVAAKQAILRELFSDLAPAEAQYIIKIITGDLRIGLKESTVEEAVGKAFGQSSDVVRRTNMALGDIGETAVRARHQNMTETGFRLFRPIKFMLATPAENEDEIYANFEGRFYIEDKYDGIRGQLHADGSRGALYSRTLDDISRQFPEIEAETQHLKDSMIVDGEVVAYRNGKVLPFAMLQKRLGRRKPPPALIEEIPVAFMIFDLLLLNGVLLIDEPLVRRKTLLQERSWPERLVLAPFQLVEHGLKLEPFFEQALLRRNEGLMLKAEDSAYVPGKRGMSWLKWKKALATLDVVVTGVELGHGRRHDVLSDYTFAIRKDGELLNIGKAYSGLTDAEILQMTEFFKAHTIQTFGRFRLVNPTVVLEVAFNGIQRSNRHKSGYALRFPRILRIRTDKTPDDIDTLETVEKIYTLANHEEA
ncbi:MAG TPA: ATP-dependent DNA ligase [Terriglobia bacterium]|nr:ATP-dependent DNA ligase [Terriglobia bacterium]